MERRVFVTSALTAPLVPSGPQPKRAGESRLISQVPTPALLLDLDAFESNLRTLADHCQRAGVGFRPHAKTHKCPEIARRQIAAGALGVCVATVTEAEIMVAAGIRGVLLTSPVVEPRKIERMVQLANRGGAMMSLGHARTAELLNEAAEAARLRVEVLIDLDVGDGRTGVTPGAQALELAQAIGRCRRLQLVGVQAYSGGASHTVGFEQRSRVSREAMGKAAETKALLAREGFEMRILSGGSTGTYNIDHEIPGVTELQVGSFIFMDVDYRRIGNRSGGAVYDDFRPSLTVLTTVVSTPRTDRVTVDAGTKALDTTTTSRPEAKDWPGLTYNRAGDEFGAVTVPPGARVPQLGDRFEFIVPHCDPSVNLYDRLHVVRGDRVEAIWPVAARRG